MDKIPSNLVDMFDEVADKRLRHTALIFGARKITYGALLTQTKKLAFELDKLTIGKSDKVALWLPNCPEFVVSFFAILRLGAIVVPINTMFKQEEAKFVIGDSGAKVLICSIDKVAEGETILARLDCLKYLISLPAPRQNSVVLNYHKLIKDAILFNNPVSLDPNATAEIVYTSGTTGTPKGACLTHRNLLTNVADCEKIISFSKNDRIICVLPLFHSFASTVCMLLPIYKGAKIIIMRTVRPFKRIIRAIFRHRVTVFVGVPSFYSILADAHFPKLFLFLNLFINPVRLCISGAAALPFDVWRKFERKFRRPLLQGYGLTESSPVVSLNPLKGKRKPESVGKALPSASVKVIDKEGRKLKNGEVGELLVNGPSVMKEYYNLPAETEKALDDGWLYTGDLAKIDSEGFVFIMGRIKEMINVRGLNVYPKEIEDVLFRHPVIKEAAVVGVTHPRRGEVPVAFVVKKEAIDEREIIRYLRQNIASYKVPRKIFFKEILPKGATGKILKMELQKEVEGIFGRQ
ncbi:MAG: long-chain fatty acid--CoA ligase [Candidatus Omnitrophica bacterium]|nr:long-chain fatty acid--CoA ligase [Candidatus Omnitrophota bacterium]